MFIVVHTNNNEYIVLAKLSIVQTFSLVHSASQLNRHKGIYIECTLVYIIIFRYMIRT